MKEKGQEKHIVATAQFTLENNPSSCVKHLKSSFVLLHRVRHGRYRRSADPVKCVKVL